MEAFSHYRLNPTEDGYEVVLYLSEQDTEFAAELGTKEKEQIQTIEEEAVSYTKKYLPNLKVKAIKIVAGTLLITSLGFINLTPKAEASTAPTQQNVTRTYIVVSGDTLSQIAVRFGTTVQAIRTSNNLTSDVIRVGQTLVIPNGTATGPTTNYVVVSGDSLFLISQRFGTTVDAIRKANNLTSDFLRVGQTLTIPSGTTSTLQTTTHTVVSGDSLFLLAQRFGTTVDAIKNRNNLSSDTLRLGQTLVIPTNGAQTSTTQTTTTPTTTYTVVSGDTLSHIAARNGTTADAIRRANNLTSDFLRIGQVLIVPISGEVRTAPTPQVQTNINQAELDLLAKIIFAEARGESLEGQIAVAAVILNRVKHNQFPNTVREVIYERSHGHFQFTPAGNGELDRANPSAVNYEAARRALAGEDPTRGSLYFYNPSKTNDQWVRSRTVSTIIGNHVFAF
ncbi:LysM peptidoglycan-binding domain-containing protein [Anaerobacillus alkaliphilus]|uniref:LysM peptidoglycan-binding domain-containing protein n=1 Tax=Anaerobacillus alkaliphilus TaxID=1548597 RepID=A0A4Q0VM84_9BACI|nr:LysM peptidoglycan-binding domain-containing protein [Anaerobacillus alkaliphilus]RXI95539.1 LysM peptidoglycan-binding domain-containing protein [Anaerobacillus alkaliphilus]